MTKQAVHPRISVTTISTWSWDVEQDIAFFLAESIPAMGVPMTKFGEAIDADVEALRASGIPVTAVSGAASESLVESGETTLAALMPGIDVTQQLNSSSFYFVTGPTPPQMPTDHAYAGLIRCLPQAVSYARDKGVRLAIEHNSISSREIGFVHSVAGVAEIARQTDIDICLELQNCWFEPDLPKLFRENVDHFCVVQVSDYLVGEAIKFNRRVPGDGSMPLEWMIGELLDAGYKGYFEIELLGPAIEAEGYAPAIHRSIDWLSERFARWGV